MSRVERIKQQNRIEDIAERYGYELKGTGKAVTVRGDTSLVIYPRTNSYHDFSGRLGDGGSVIDFVMHHEGITFNAALDMLDDGQSEYTAPQRSFEPEDDNTEFAEKTKAKNRRDLTPALALEGLRDLYPFINDTTPFQHLLGYSHYHNSLTFELPDLSINRRTQKGKWIATAGNKRNFIPHKIDDRSHYVYLYSGMAEIVSCEAMAINYIGLQMDHSDSKITDEIKTKMKDKTLVIIEENDDSSRDLSQRLRKMFFNVKIMKIGNDKNYGYDLRDFVNDKGSFEISAMMLQAMADVLPLEEHEVQDEIVINYEGKYIDLKGNVDLTRGCVIVAVMGSGKTHTFKNNPGDMILVPRVQQTDTGKGDKTDYVINKALTEGAILTYEKFIGHYKVSEEFRDLVNSKKIRIIVDEAHKILSSMKAEYKLIYELDAIFMSGTLSQGFRTDLQRYKFMPTKENRTKIFYTDGDIPDFDTALYFIDKANVLIQNYYDCCVVGAEHNFDNVNLHSKEVNGKIFSTNAAREGVSIETGVFESAVVVAGHCGLWNTKDIIQGVGRVRGDSVLRIVTKPIEAQKEVIGFDYYSELAKSYTSTQLINTIIGEEYSIFIKLTHKWSNYIKVSDFGVACYLAYKNRNHYDNDLYIFEEYTPDATFEIDTSIDGKEEEEILLQHTMDNGDIYEYPKKKREPFMRWAKHKESGLVDRFMRMSNFATFGAVYENSRISHDTKAQYNRMFNRGKDPRKYSISKFYELMRSVVKIDIQYDGQSIERLSKKMKLKDAEIRVISECPIDGVKYIGTDKFKISSFTIEDRALNYPINAHHSAKTANEVGRPVFTTKNEQKTEQKQPENEAKINPYLEGTDADRVAWANESFFDELQEAE